MIGKDTPEWGSVCVVNEETEPIIVLPCDLMGVVRGPDPEAVRMRAAGLMTGYQHGQQAAELDGKHRQGWMQGSDAELVLMVKMNDECEHEASEWTPTPCGHPWCERCQGYVDTQSRVALKGPGPIIACNRRRKPWE